jgi:CDP-2,3-bis-(O-geranylgeranyl)-sn-glycerol synthase
MNANPVACASFLIAAFVLAGFAQTAWFGSRWSHAFGTPLDGGLTFRGRRVLGDNKTLRGFVVMVPAAACAFAALSLIAGDARTQILWPLSPVEYAALGAWAGLGFMAGELPNSFVKRQIGIAPGRRASSRAAAVLQFLVDRADSGIGMLAAMSVAVPTPPLTWAIVLLAGAPLHWAFAALMYQLGLKGRPA